MTYLLAVALLAAGGDYRTVHRAIAGESETVALTVEIPAGAKPVHITHIRVTCAHRCGIVLYRQGREVAGADGKIETVRGATNSKSRVRVSRVAGYGPVAADLFVVFGADAGRTFELNPGTGRGTIQRNCALNPGDRLTIRTVPEMVGMAPNPSASIGAVSIAIRWKE